LAIGSNLAALILYSEFIPMPYLTAPCSHRSFPWQAVLGILLLSLSSTNASLLEAAETKAQPNLLSFDPFREKAELNQSQDRIIKKKSFNTIGMGIDHPVANKEIGLFATVDYERIRSTLEGTDPISDKKAEAEEWLNKVLSQSSISGIACLIPWKYLQPSEESPNWKIIDNLLNYCQQHNKLLILRISTAGLDNETSSAVNEQIFSDTPSWVFDGGAQSFTYTTKDQQQERLPIFWDEIYLAKWSNFVKQLGTLYDKNANIHSIGITGGGMLGSTNLLPPVASAKDKHSAFEQVLKNKYGMNARQLLVHWKYVADLFVKAFPTTRLNFDIDPPTPDSAGQESLDEIANYLVFRYGERVYLTRQNVNSAKHDFDQYRLILKYRADTLTGYQVSRLVKPDQIVAIAKCALDDGVSFAEIPVDLVLSDNDLVKKGLNYLEDHIGYQLVAKEVTLPSSLKSGEPLKATFSFLNLGSATPIKPLRNLERDKASSYKIQLTLKDQNDSPVFISLHTPSPPTNLWNTNKPIEWEKDLKMAKLKPGNYSVLLSLIDVDSKHKLSILNSLNPDKVEPASDIALTNVQIVE
jgi:hypothetical protein